VLEKHPTRPHDYAVFNLAWTALLAGLLATTRSEGPPLRELPLFGLASFSLTKSLSKEKVGTWVRTPVVDESVPERRCAGDERGQRLPPGGLRLGHGRR
jgi:hypothetical protein